MEFDAFTRAARSLLAWSQQDLANEASISKPTIANIESGKTVNVNATTAESIMRAFRRHGVFRKGDAIEKRDTFVTIYKSYVDVLNEISQYVPDGGIIYVHCADDRKSSDEVAAKLREMRNEGYIFNTTICAGNHTIAGPIDQYRWIDKDFFAESEVSVIYTDNVVQHIPADNDGNGFFLCTHSKANAQVMRKQFEYWWNKGKRVGDE